ncbi:hypothetical protein O59_001606 [Cellvibrio sp. BR]|nr:hypothetical protein O59_001606 [Cellvibrio sp. BR]
MIACALTDLDATEKNSWNFIGKGNGQSAYLLDFMLPSRP